MMTPYCCAWLYCIPMQGIPAWEELWSNNIISQKSVALRQEVINIPKQLTLRSLVWESKCFHWAYIYIVVRDDMGPLPRDLCFCFHGRSQMCLCVCLPVWEGQSLPDLNHWPAVTDDVSGRTSTLSSSVTQLDVSVNHGGVSTSKVRSLGYVAAISLCIQLI